MVTHTERLTNYALSIGLIHRVASFAHYDNCFSAKEIYHTFAQECAIPPDRMNSLIMKCSTAEELKAGLKKLDDDYGAEAAARESQIFLAQAAPTPAPAEDPDSDFLRDPDSGPWHNRVTIYEESK